jgi:hypothetical protein
MIKKCLLQLAFTALFCFAFGASAVAQIALVDQLGRPIQAKHYTNIIGSPFLSDNWATGSVKMTSGIMYEGMQLMYDQLEDQLLFRNQAGQTQLFADPVLEFSILERVFRKGYTPVDGAAPTAFYEVLADGRTQLLKRTSKKVFEDLPYGSSTKVKTIQENDNYYISQSGSVLIKIKKDKKTLLAVLDDQKPKLEAYTKSERLDLKKEADMVKLLAYYNTL